MSSQLRSMRDVFLRTWYLGFTSFGGPAVHFQIFHRLFVEGQDPWIDEQTYQELFAISQALPGPGSTKMGFCIALIRGGFLSAIMFFLTWSLPGAAGMYVLAVGVSRISTVLPLPVYPLLSGLNASTVGIIAFAAVQLATKAITDELSRLIVVFSACAGLCYNALWYFPVLLVAGGTATAVWDLWARSFVGKLISRWRRRRTEERNMEGPGTDATLTVEVRTTEHGHDDGLSQRSVLSTRSTIQMVQLRQNRPPAHSNADEHNSPNEDEGKASVGNVKAKYSTQVKVGFSIVLTFFVSFIAIMVANAKVKSPLVAFRVFRNMYLAGTIIFGGGPVVIPLLREYVVQPGFVTPRDFLLGLAIIQAFPGPNFNFAVYLGGLALAPTSTPSIVGALLGYIGIFAPGLILASGFQALWRMVRSRPSVIAVLRGINAAAVGLVFTAVYRLWEIGYLTPGREDGISLGTEPWWVVIAVLTYTSAAWFRVETWIGIVGGGILGLCWYGVVKPQW